MRVQLGLSGSTDDALGLRHHSERRVGTRRAYTRGTPERRRRDRRRNKIRSMIFASLALTLPLKLKHHTALTALPSGPRVTTTIDSVVPIPAKKAYEGIILEAAARYGVDASLIRSVMQAESAFDPS